MLGLTIGDKHTKNDYGLELLSVSVSLPETKTTYVEVPGSDEELDFTEAFGTVRYHQREIGAAFVLITNGLADWHDKVSAFASDVHGQRVEITLDDDPDYFYAGRAAVRVDEKTNDSLTFLYLSARVHPYKRKQTNTVMTATLSDAVQTLNLKNLREQVIPLVSVNGSANIVFGDTTYNLSAGEYTLPALILKAGYNFVDVSGSGTVSFTYREGML